jgi:hypothetical protein
MNMHKPSAESNFCDENKEAQKPLLLKILAQMATSVKRTEYLIAVQLVTKHVSGTEKKLLFTRI